MLRGYGLGSDGICYIKYMDLEFMESFGLEKQIWKFLVQSWLNLYF